jgi:alkaline phosphatase D
MPRGPDMRLYRQAMFGNLLQMQVLDTRQYRTDQPCGEFVQPRCAEALDPAATMTGPEQERWLLESLGRSEARWNVIAQQTMLAQFDFLPGADQLFNVDQWDGYVAARNRILGFLMHRKPSNPVVITGDIHSSWVHELKSDFANPSSPTVGTEFVGTSICSSFPEAFIPIVQAALPDNPHTKFFDGALRGYVRCTVTPRRWRSDYRVVPSVLTREAPVSTLASFEVQNGEPGPQQVPVSG